MLESEANDSWAKAGAHEPGEQSWGFFSYLDIAPGLCGGGVGAFTWLHSEAELLEFLQQVVPAATPMVFEEKVEAQRAIGEAILAQRVMDGFGVEAVRSAMNDKLAGHIWVEWIGSFEDLLEGDHRYALYVRARFHQHRTDDEEAVEREAPLEVLQRQGKAIAEYDRAGFLDYLVEWGM